MTMKLTDHDEFLHLGYPRELTEPWKENYYFNYIDRESDALGIFHCSFQRHRKVVSISTHQVIDGTPISYSQEIPLPASGPQVLDDQVIISDGNLCFEVLEPHHRHRVSFKNEQVSMVLNYTRRFDVYDFNSHVADRADKGFQAAHYEQGMFVAGEITVNGHTKTISCLGHRDHTWGYRDETGLGGWHWIAVQCENSTWNITRIKRLNSPDSQTGFVSYRDRAEAITSVDVLNIEYNAHNEPVNCRYRVTLDSGERFHVSARRFTRMHLNSKKLNVIHHENFSEFLIEETGETGIGVDEHMVVKTR